MIHEWNLRKANRIMSDAAKCAVDSSASEDPLLKLLSEIPNRQLVLVILELHPLLFG
jgi:hypothetical protein